MFPTKTMLEAVGFTSAWAIDRTRRRARLLRDLCKLFLLEARDNPKDRAHLLACAEDIYRRYRKATSSSAF